LAQAILADGGPPLCPAHCRRSRQPLLAASPAAAYPQLRAKMFAANGFKGKGKGKDAKGKGKGKGKMSAEGGKGHTLPRTRLSAEKFTGTVAAWKGKYGWITPSEEIEHEKAKLHNGSLFVGMNDIEAGQELSVGATVEFHICEDDSGLGAEEVVQISTAPPGAAAAAAKGCGKTSGKSFGASAAKGGKDNGKNGAAKGASWGKDASSWNSWGGKGGAAATPYGGKGWTSPATGKVANGGKFGGGKADGGKDKGKGKGKGKDGKSPGHLLPRSRISAEKFTGTVVDWKGKYGWIQPAEEIQHEKAGKHQGRLFVGRDDLEGVEALDAGATVEFHLWEDASGLGAEEVVQY